MEIQVLAWEKSKKPLVKVLEVFCTSPKPGPGFPYVMVFFVLSVVRC
jgi:hypothetical protein